MNKLNFKIALAKNDTTQIALADRLKIDRAHLSRIACGWDKPKEELKKRICAELKVSIKELFGDE